MNSLRLYTRNIGGLDYRVWTTMLAACVISIGLFGYQQIKSASMTLQPCENFRFIINGKKGTVANCNLGSLSIFQLSTEASAKVEWDFDDGTAVKKGSIVQHQFLKEGDYKIMATVNDHCEYIAWVTVKVLASQEAEVPAIKIYADSLKAMVGSQIRFSGGANFEVVNYNWEVPLTKENKTGQTVTFSFPATGKYEVILIANNDPTKADRKTIEIIAYPPTSLPGLPPLGPDIGPFPPGVGGVGNPKPPKPFEKPEKVEDKPVVQPSTPEVADKKRLDINEETFKELLQLILKGEEEINRLYDYLDLDETTSVSVNGSNDLIKLKTFCQENKKRKVQSVKFRYNDKNEISRLDVKLKRKGLFG